MQALPASGSVRIGPGLRAEGSYVVAQKCGVVRQTRNGKLWLESKQKRWDCVKHGWIGMCSMLFICLSKQFFARCWCSSRLALAT